MEDDDEKKARDERWEYNSRFTARAGCWHVGLTYDLRADYLAAGYGEEETAEFDRPDTIEGIADALGQLGHTVDRIGHVKHLVQRLAAGDRWDLVFNICEGLYGTGRESQVPAILDVFQIPYTFSDPLVTSVCLDKRMTKLVVRDAGVPTPRFLLVHSLTTSPGWRWSSRCSPSPWPKAPGKALRPLPKS